MEKELTTISKYGYPHHASDHQYVELVEVLINLIKSNNCENSNVILKYVQHQRRHPLFTDNLNIQRRKQMLMKRKSPYNLQASILLECNNNGTSILR